MGILMLVVSLMACLQTVYLYPLQDGGNFQLYDNFGMGLAKRPYLYSDALMSPLNYLGGSPSRSQAHRKKAVDSTFIRFGRSVPSSPQDLPLFQQQQADYPQDLPPLYLLQAAGCRLRSGQELLKALLNDPACIRALHKDKKENVNDTFIRFGKREAPPEREFESSSKEASR